MGSDIRMTAPTLKVLAALLGARGQEACGSEIAKATKLPSGTLYPILYRLEGAGWLTARQEQGDPTDLGRPRRRYYRVTALGAAKTRQAADELTPHFGKLGWT